MDTLVVVSNMDCLLIFLLG